MKILTIVFNLGLGGTQRSAVVFAKEYSNLGIESAVLASSLEERNDRIEDLRAAGCKVWTGASSANLEEIKKWNPDVVHFHSHGISNSEFIKINNHLNNSKIKYVETNVFARPSPWASYLDYSFQLSDWCMWSYSNRMKRQSAEKLYKIPNPVECERFQRKSTEEINEFKSKHGLDNEFVLGRVGQAIDSKWSKCLIRAFESICVSGLNVKLLLVNPPISILKQRNDSVVKDKIIVLGKVVGDENLSLVYSAIDLFCLDADQGETFGYVATESMLCGTPVVTLNSPWADNSQFETINHGVAGIATNTFEDYVDEIKGLILDKKRLEGFANNARESIVARYDAYTVTSSVVNLLSSPVKYTTEKDGHRKMVEQLELSSGNTNIATRYFYKNFSLRYLTRLTSGYQTLGEFLSSVGVRVLNRLKNAH